MDVSEARKLRTLEEEYGRLKRLLAYAMLDNAALKGSPKENDDARRVEGCSAPASGHEMSERRACRVLGVDRTSIRYHASKPDDAELRDG